MIESPASAVRSAAKASSTKGFTPGDLLLETLLLLDGVDGWAFETAGSISRPALMKIVIRCATITTIMYNTKF